MKKSALVTVALCALGLASWLQPIDGLATGANQDAPPKHIKLDGIFATPGGSNSQIIPSDQGDIVEITNGTKDQKGAVWSTANNMMDLTQDFESQMYIYFGGDGEAAADGMAFVMHNDPEMLNGMIQGNWEGGRLGVWEPTEADEHGYAIKNSLAVEFDTHHNDKFDDIAEKQDHIAWNYPSSEESYEDYIEWLPIAHKVRKMAHNDLQYPGELSTDQWFSFKISWNTAASQLTYQFGSLAPVTITVDPQSTFGSNSVYWGFTGSTGDQVEMNRVVFEHVPGLVDAAAQTQITDKDGNSVIDGQVWPGDTLNYQIQGTYQSGKQDWLDVQYATTLHEGVTYVPGTLEILRSDGSIEKLPDSSWQGKELNLSLGNLSSTTPIIEVHFQVTANEVSEPLTVTEKSAFNGQNYMTATPPVQYQIAVAELTIQLDQEGQEEVRLLGEDYSLTGSWQSTKAGTFTITPVVNGTELAPFTQDNPTPGTPNPFTGQITADQLQLGDNQITYKIISADGRNQSSSGEVLVKVMEKPELTLEHADEEIPWEFGQAYPFNGTWLDKDSDTVDLYYTLDDGAKTPIDEEIDNPDKGKAVAYDESLSTEQLTLGEHTLTVYAKDAEGFESEKETVTLQVSGSLHFVTVDEEVAFEQATIGDKHVKRSGPWQIQVQDTRGTGENWDLGVKLAADFVDKDHGNRSLAGQLIYQDQAGQEQIISTEDVLTVYSKETTNSEIIDVTWAEEQGILFNIFDSAYQGVYQGTLEWVLTDGPA
ncbi:L-type lectin-domain containing protein [Enterococcus diestrammenae]|uniref:L-type lectin-domain containing protein n=1 Tax=Enterococcus diestrammenae TaxID=1155073 RepID=UPI00195D4AA0